jgi:uncharacterized membrane protein YphA (DoxX/SURF4 family)
MYSVFPYVLSFWLYVPLLLRVVTGTYFLIFGYRGLKEDWHWKLNLFQTIWHKPAKVFAYTVAIVEMIGGVLLFIGLFVQPTVLVLAIISITAISIKLHDKSLIHRDINIYILLTTILASLFVLGAGYHAFDLPL